MAEPPPASSRTPPGAPLNEPTRHLDSMEEAGPERVQKRPRLDSGSGVSPSISIDAAAVAASASAPASAVATPTPASASDMDTTSDQARPAKVTINVKSPTSAEIDIAHTMREPSPVPPGTPTRPNSTEPTGSPPHVISISSSPTQSPEIQAADPEDMDENWRSLSDAIKQEDVVEVHDLPSSLVDTFPRVRENLPARDNLARIVNMIQKGTISLSSSLCVWLEHFILIFGETADPRDADAASAVKTWMDDCVKNLDRLTLEEFGESQEFWQQLPDAVESVLRRP